MVDASGINDFYNMHRVTSTPTAATTTPKNRTYVIEKGDTLSSIADMFDLTWRDVLNANRHLIQNPNVIQVGWTLRIPERGIVVTASVKSEQSKTVTAQPQARDEYHHVVQVGDTLSKIARKYGYGFTADDIVRLNPGVLQNLNAILPGTQIKIAENPFVNAVMSQGDTEAARSLPESVIPPKEVGDILIVLKNFGFHISAVRLWYDASGKYQKTTFVADGRQVFLEKFISRKTLGFSALIDNLRDKTPDAKLILHVQDVVQYFESK